MPSEATIIAKARERERRFLADLEAHPGLPNRFEDLLIYIEDNLLDLRELAAGRGLDFKQCAGVYIDGVVETWRTIVPGGATTAGQLGETLRGLLRTL